MITEKNVIDVFTRIAHGKLNIGDGTGVIDLASAQLILEPRLKNLEAEVGTLHARHGIEDGRIGSLRAAESVTALVVGVLAGLDLAGRPDIVGKFAKLYAESAASSIDSLFVNKNKH